MTTEETTIHTQVPARLMTLAESLVEDGWFGDLDGLMVDALRRFLEAHRPDLMESYVWEDVEWGLRGRD